MKPAAVWMLLGWGAVASALWAYPLVKPALTLLGV
jgi:hypothetical protein